MFGIVQMATGDLTCEVGPPCSLVLADGSVFQGRSFGAQVPVDGEVGKYNNIHIDNSTKPLVEFR